MSNNTISAIEPPCLPHHERRLYEVYDDTLSEEDNLISCLEMIQDESGISQATTALEGM